MNHNSIEAHNNMTAKISLHGQMIMSHLPELITLKFINHPWAARKKPLSMFSRVAIIPGATCDEIARFCGLDYMQVVRRCSELKRAGLIIESPEKFTYISGGRRFHKTIWRAVNNEK